MMSDPDDNPIRYVHVAKMYWDAGWRGIFPLEHGRKGGKEARIPPGFTGRTGRDTSYADIMQWMETRGNGNIALRLTGTPDYWIIGIDVDNYNGKNGGATLEEATRRWGDLPPAPRSTSRGADDPISGIRLFKIPVGEELEENVSFADLGLGDVEIVQRHHRYVVAWPSLHPEGRTYWWYDDNRNTIDIPHVDTINYLPDKWLNGLRAKAKTTLDQAPGVDYDVQQALTTGDMSRAVLDRLHGAAKELSGPGVCHHDCVRKHTLAMLHLGKSGEQGVRLALEQLGTLFVELVEDSRDGGAEEATREFKALIFGPGAGRSLGKVEFLDRPRDWLDDDDPKEEGPPARQRINAERVASEPAQPGGAIIEDTSTYTPKISASAALEEIEQGFWDSRDSLRAVYQTAMASLGSPWAVLGICAARALAQVRPHVTLPPTIGAGPGSLNWFGAIVAAAAGGKTTAVSIAEYLVPGHIITCQQGTGEGILKMFGKAADPNDPDAKPEFEAIMLDVDEIDSLGAVSSRTGSTTMPLLRSAFSGATLGFSYSAADKRRFVRRHTYRMTGIVGMQPKRAGWILADADGGTPQRFMWFPASDARVRRERPWKANPLELPKHTEWLYPREIIIPKVAEDLIIDEHVKRMQGGRDALDGHALFCREKFAYALAVLDGRVTMNEEDWELSGIAADVSMYTREMVVDELKKAAHIEAVDRGETRGVEMAAAKAMQELEEAERLRAALRWALERIRGVGEDGISTREMNRKTSKHTRRLLPFALERAQQDGLVRLKEGTTKWVLV